MSLADESDVSLSGFILNMNRLYGTHFSPVTRSNYFASNPRFARCSKDLF